MRDGNAEGARCHWGTVLVSLRVCTGVTGGLYWCHWLVLGRMGSCRNYPAMAAATCGAALEGHGAFWWLLVTAGPGNLHALGPVSHESCTPWIGFFHPIRRVLSISRLSRSIPAFPRVPRGVQDLLSPCPVAWDRGRYLRHSRPVASPHCCHHPVCFQALFFPRPCDKKC